jgi:hypothetical protein
MRLYFITNSQGQIRKHALLRHYVNIIVRHMQYLPAE